VRRRVHTLTHVKTQARTHKCAGTRDHSSPHSTVANPLPRKHTIEYKPPHREGPVADTVTTIFVDVTVGALLLLALPVVVVALRNAFAVLDGTPASRFSSTHIDFRVLVFLIFICVFKSKKKHEGAQIYQPMSQMRADSLPNDIPSSTLPHKHQRNW